MKSNMTINVEFLAGTSLEDALQEAKQKAGDMDVVYVCFRFNGSNFSIGRNADIDDVMEQWNDDSGNNSRIFCSA